MSDGFVKSALQTLDGIDSGEVSLYLVGEDWYSVWAGNVRFRTSTGWQLTVFNDCDEWDYLDTITSPAGESMDFDEIYETPELSNWTPRDESKWSLAVEASDEK